MAKSEEIPDVFYGWSLFPNEDFIQFLNSCCVQGSQSKVSIDIHLCGEP